MMKKILIGSKKSKESVNVDNFISVDLSAKQREILITNVNESVDSDDVYNNERDESTAYRAIFTINPICTNVLFNAITEVVYDDGGKNAIKVPKGEIVNGKISTNSSLEPPINAKNKERLYGRQVIRDTEYSHPDIGDYTYYCGIDIFNNHILRSTDFNLVSKRDGEMYKNKSNISDDTVIECNYPLANNENVTYTIEDTFNSIRDYVRDRNGEPVSEMYFNRKNLYMSNGKPYSNINDIPRQVIHNYQADNLMSFYESYTTNLIEKDGWFGFNNPSKLDIPNYIINGKEAIINKCINSEKSCSFIDLYPDRSLFSFIPKVNKKRNNRIEKNWDYCLTYPYRNDYNNELISDIDEELNALYVNSVTLTKFNNKWLLTFSSCIPHNLKITSFIQLYVKDLDSDNEKYVKIPIKSKIYNLGTVQKTDKKYSFTIDGTNVIEYFTNEDIENDPGNYTLKPHLQCRFTKIVNGYECEYYIRILRKIPNFRFAKERIEDIEPDKLKNYIEEYQNTNFDSIINKLAFSENIYTDKLAQIVFIDDINVNELTDNLNRPLSEIYLTIVKANRGHDLWYPEYDKDNPISPVYNDEKIEYSHAFSKVTSGFDLGRRITYNESGTSSTDTTIYCSKIEDNNVHMLHNVNLNQLNNDDLGINGSDVEFRMNSDLFNIPNSAKPLEDNIMVDVDDDNPVEFGCDIVEFSPSEVIESSLCEVNHRFNTAQRECINNEYCDMFFDTIANDDYDVGVLDESDVDTYDCPFKIIEELYNMTEKKEKLIYSQKVIYIGLIIR